MAREKGLGRGLGALLGEEFDQPQAATPYKTVPIYKVEPNPGQPRESFDEEELASLAESIRQHGVLQPLTVRERGDGYYSLIAGERRWRAARMAGLSDVPAIVMDVDDREAAELALIENLQRQNLNPLEEARGYKSLIEQYGMTQERAADAVGKSRPAVANALRLLALPESILDKVAAGELTAGHARALLTLKTEKQQMAAAQKIMALSLSVRQTETLCRRMAREQTEKKPEKALKVDYVAECERNLSRRLGRGVKIVNGKRKGKFELEFYGADDLQALLDALMTLRPTKKEKENAGH